MLLSKTYLRKLTLYFTICKRLLCCQCYGISKNYHFMNLDWYLDTSTQNLYLHFFVYFSVFIKMPRLCTEKRAQVVRQVGTYATNTQWISSIWRTYVLQNNWKVSQYKACVQVSWEQMEKACIERQTKSSQDIYWASK